MLLKQSAWEVVTEILALNDEVQTKTALLLWKWWSVRNKINKREKSHYGQEVAAEVLNLLSDLKKLEVGPVRREGERAGWIVPPPGQLKINSDGSFIHETMQGSWSFIVRDHDGDVVLAGAGHLGLIPDAITAEAAACAQALQASTDQGISHVQVEVDSTVLQQALQSSSMDLVTCGMLIRDACSMLNEHFVCSNVLSVPRACNGLAHNLAKLALSWDRVITIYGIALSQNLY